MRLDDVRWVCVGTHAGELGGELQSAHHDAGFSLVNAGFAESVAHLRDGALDALRAFNRGELQSIVGVFGAVESYM